MEDFSLSKRQKKLAKQNYFIFKYFLLASLLSTGFLGCSTQPPISTLKNNSDDVLLNKYREMRKNNWNSYAQPKKNRPIKKATLPPSVSIEHLRKNAIFQQVTQIHCYKIRVSEDRCNAIRYLAMINCGEIKKENQIKRYLKCLELNFKN